MSNAHNHERVTIATFFTYSTYFKAHFNVLQNRSHTSYQEHIINKNFDKYWKVDRIIDLKGVEHVYNSESFRVRNEILRNSYFITSEFH